MTDFFKAKEALEKALEVINDDSATELAKLEAYSQLQDLLSTFVEVAAKLDPLS